MIPLLLMVRPRKTFLLKPRGHSYSRKEIQTSKISLMIHLVVMTYKFDLYIDGKRKYKNICY